MASQVFTTTGSQSWNWPAGVTSVTAEGLGGGGGGGTASGNPASGGGGRGGGYAKAVITKGVESSLTIVVGQGGAAASAGAATTITQSSTTRLLANAGAGGSSAATNSTNGAGGNVPVGGTAVGTTINAGGNGGTGNFTAGTQGSGAGGGAAGPTAAGGAASINVAGTANAVAWADGVVYSGAGAAGVGDSTAGTNGPSAGSVYGGGGSGGKANANPDRAGGTGRQGVVVLTWTVPVTGDLTRTLEAAFLSNAYGVRPLGTIVQRTGLVTASGTGTLSITFPTPPAIGNGLIVMGCSHYESGSGAAPSCSDNYNGAWTDLGSGSNVDPTGYVWNYAFCLPRVNVTGASLTVTFGRVGGGFQWAGVALEIDGIRSSGLSASYVGYGSSGTSTTPTTLAPDITIGVPNIQIAVLGARVASAGSVAVTAATPNWTQEGEQLSPNMVCEFDSRFSELNGVTAQAQWTMDVSAGWGTNLAVLTSTGLLPLVAAATPTLANASVVATGLLERSGTATLTLGAATASATGIVEDAPAGGVTVTYDFTTKPDANPLPDPPWQAVMAAMQNLSGHGTPVAFGTTSGVRWNPSVNTFDQDQFVEIKIGAGSATAGYSQFIFLRGSGTDSSFNALSLYWGDGYGGAVNIGRIDGGGYTHLQTTGISVAVGHWLRLEVEGTTMRAYRKTSDAGTYAQIGTDQTSGITAYTGQPGFGGRYVNYDNADVVKLGDLGGAEPPADITGVLSATLDAATVYGTGTVGAPGDIVFDSASTGGTNAGTGALTFAFTNVAGDCVVVGVRRANAFDLTTVTYGGVAMTQAAVETFASNLVKTYLYLLVGPPTGTHNVVASASTNELMHGVATSYRGVHQTTPLDAIDLQRLTGTTLTLSTTTTPDKCRPVAVAQNAPGITPSAGSGTTQRTVDASSQVSLYDGPAVTPSGTTSLIVQFGASGVISGVLASLVPAEAAPPTDLTGTASLTLGSLSLTTDADVEVRGTFAKTLAPLTLTTDVDVEVHGFSSQTLGPATLSGVGKVEIQGTGIPALTPATLSAVGLVTAAPTANLSVTLATATLVAAGSTEEGHTGSLSVTLDQATLTTDGDVVIGGVLVQTLGQATLSATGGVELRGNANTTLGPVLVTSTGSVLVQGTGLTPLAPATLVASASSVPGHTGDLSVTLAPVTTTTDVDLLVQGIAALVLGPLTLSSTGLVTAAGGGLLATLADATLVGTAQLEIQGNSSTLLERVTLTADGTLLAIATGDLTATLGPATLSATVAVAVQGGSSLTLAPMTLLGRGVVGVPVEGEGEGELGAVLGGKSSLMVGGVHVGGGW